MRDYKNVKVPKKHRTAVNRVTVKRVGVSGNARIKAKGTSGLKAVLTNMLSLCVIAGCCWLGWHGYRIMTTAEVFQVSGVDVKGMQRLGGGDLNNIVGSFTGQNIFRVDLESAARRARANPWIKDVRIHRRLPNRIAMTVVERSPYAILETEAGRYLIDIEGVVIDRVTNDSSGSFPVIVIKNYQAHPGESVMSESIQEALILLAEIDARGGWQSDHVVIKANTRETLTMIYADHEFKIGSGKYDVKLRRLAEVMADVQQRGLDIAYVDLRPEHQAAVMLKDDEERGEIQPRHQTKNKHE